MIEFTVVAEDFKNAINIILAGRTEHMDTDTAEFKAVGNLLELNSVGTEAKVDAEVAQTGRAWLPLPVLANINKLAASFNRPKLDVRIEEGRVRIESSNLSHEGIELKEFGAKKADIPVDASVLDTLALVRLFSREEIAESGLTARVQAAYEKSVAAIEGAVTCLAEFEVP